MEPNEKIYGIHWNTDTGARWQLTSQNYLRVDVTHEFDAKFRLVAYKDLMDNEAEALREIIALGDIDNVSCGQLGYKGVADDIFKYTAPPGYGFGWRVTNCARVSPGLRHEWTTTGVKVGSDFSDYITPHPADGYSVQFNAVPWDIFKRYWRKPINLDRKFHGSRRSKWAKHGFASGSAAIEVLDFDLTVLKQRKCFFADFSFMWSNRTRTSNVNMCLWMLQNVRGFSMITDADSPFARADDELCFTMEWM